MRYSRTGIIIALVGAEIFIAGAIFATLGRSTPWAFAADSHRVAFTPKQFDPIDAGSAPRVRIEDADSTVTVRASADGRVHVYDNSSFGGNVFARRQPAQLAVVRTADGVEISRPESSGFTIFGGWFDWKITVEVPAGSTLEIPTCSGAEISGLTGPVTVHSDDGAVVARDLRGNTDLTSDDGHIEASNVHANRLTASTSDGRLQLDGIAVDMLQAKTDDGSIGATGLQVGGGSLQTADGSVRVALLAGNLSVHAHTDDGSITFDGREASSNDDDDSSTGDYHIGSGGGALQVATQDGSIHITTNGVQ